VNTEVVSAEVTITNEASIIRLLTQSSDLYFERDRGRP
jgi:hypothetical protein